ncbi:MAG: hypothetical protein EXR62_05415 [Chloroflexi bacterium]|nr:hypothetical protein [Chloroflexota bacterium]
MAIETTYLPEIQEIYAMRDSSSVQSFLESHPQLVGLLLEAYPHLLESFGPQPEVILEVVRNPEAEEPDQLFAYIRTSLPISDALARLDTFDETWFLDQLDRVDDLFNFNLEAVAYNRSSLTALR